MQRGAPMKESSNQNDNLGGKGPSTRHIVGNDIYKLCVELFPIDRSLTGNGTRKTLDILKRELPQLNIYEVLTGTKCFDWTIPREWNCKEAYIITPEGDRICDFSKNNLHLVGYSIPIKKTIPLEELNDYFHSLPELPEAIPYVTSYYKERWGFCISHNERKNLKDGEYKVVINSTLEDGSLTYGELLIPGKTKEEVFLSTYVCHPSMGNNELSGPTVTTHLAKYIQSLENRRYSYRIIFIPETIGSIMYLSKNLNEMKRNMVAGFNVTCVGDNNSYSYLPSRNGGTLADKIALHVLKQSKDNFNDFSFLDRGSDERQYCSPGIDLPVCSVMRTKYLEFKEYHTSLDNLNYIGAKGLNGAYEVYVKIINALENNYKYVSLHLCEPQLGKRGLYPTMNTKDTKSIVNNMMNFLVYCDGTNDLIDISNKINLPIWELYKIIEDLLKNNLISIKKP
jgi:aminopeptidase-like protein